MMPLDPKQVQFNWPNARALAERCALTYTDTVMSLAAKNIAARMVWNAQTDTEAMVIDEGDCVSVAFRGSRALKDWIQDFKFKPEHPRTELFHEADGQAAEIHTGFMQDVESVNEDLTHVLAGLAPKPTSGIGRPIFLTGHSKGGGEVILFALELQRLGYNLAGVYTFGQPRVGNLSFANIYNSTLFEETFRVVNQNDIVPRVPGVLMKYRHCGQEIFLTVGGGWDANPSILTKLFSDALGLWGAYRTATDVLVAEHNIGAYQGRIQLL